ncbi:hypothetical protein PS2_025853 [Malus domestica]
MVSNSCSSSLSRIINTSPIIHLPKSNYPKHNLPKSNYPKHSPTTRFNLPNPNNLYFLRRSVISRPATTSGTILFFLCLQSVCFLRKQLVFGFRENN